MEEKVMISKAEYNRLIEAQAFLDCLDACGVDNWGGYSDAREMYREESES